MQTSKVFDTRWFRFDGLDRWKILDSIRLHCQQCNPIRYSMLQNAFYHMHVPRNKMKLFHSILVRMRVLEILRNSGLQMTFNLKSVFSAKLLKSNIIFQVFGVFFIHFNVGFSIKINFYSIWEKNQFLLRQYLVRTYAQSRSALCSKLKNVWEASKDPPAIHKIKQLNLIQKKPRSDEAIRVSYYAYKRNSPKTMSNENICN